MFEVGSCQCAEKLSMRTIGTQRVGRGHEGVEVGGRLGVVEGIWETVGRWYLYGFYNIYNFYLVEIELN